MAITDHKVYIFTIPKAGTYLMSAFLELLGIRSTGWHISEHKYLDTKSFDDDTNRMTPSKTMQKRSYLASFRNVPFGGHAFGHFSPLFLAPGELRKYKVIAVKRSLEEALVSEFIDFRYRRRDVKFVSKKEVPNSIEAFERYMDTHAQVFKKIGTNFLLLEEMMKNSLYRDIVGGDRMLFVDFSGFVDSTTGPGISLTIAASVGANLNSADVKDLWVQALNMNNKTKSDGVILDVDRREFWTQHARARFRELGLDELNTKLGYQSLI